MNDKSVRDTSLWTSLVFNPGVTDVQKDAVRTAHHVVVAPNERIMSASVSYILEEKYGFARAAREERPVDADGRPIPLYSYPTLHYLDGLDWSTSDIFEFGAGHSTLWWAERARSVTSAETDDGWARHLRGKLPENTTIVQVAEHDLVRSLRDQEKSFDVIVVDCAANRYLAAAAALDCLSPSGIILLDNSEVVSQHGRHAPARGLAGDRLCRLQADSIVHRDNVALSSLRISAAATECDASSAPAWWQEPPGAQMGRPDPAITARRTPARIHTAATNARH
jgi:hypothetical protein